MLQLLHLKNQYLNTNPLIRVLRSQHRVSHVLCHHQDHYSLHCLLILRPLGLNFTNLQILLIPVSSHFSSFIAITLKLCFLLSSAFCFILAWIQVTENLQRNVSSPCEFWKSLCSPSLSGRLYILILEENGNHQTLPTTTPRNISSTSMSWFTFLVYFLVIDQLSKGGLDPFPPSNPIFCPLGLFHQHLNSLPN